MSTAHDEAMALVEEIKPILAGRNPAVQGAALADLLAMWLAGHVRVGDPKATERLRRDMLKAHVVAVKLLIPLNYWGIIEPELKRRTN